MQVNSVSVSQTFGERKVDHELLKQYASMSPEELRKISLEYTDKTVGEKKHRRINNGVIYSIPLAAGISAALNASKFSKAGRLITIGSTALSWLITLGTIDAVFAVGRKTAKSNPALRNYLKEHPVQSFLLGIGAAMGACTAIAVGGPKLFSKVMKSRRVANSHFINTLGIKSVALYDRFAKAVNNSRVLGKLSKVSAKVPSAAKGIIKTMFSWSPVVLVMTSFAHSINHQRIRAQQFNKNYNDALAGQQLAKMALAQEEVISDAVEV